MRSEAVQLFAQRGQAVSPSFDVSDGNAPLMADICQRLDGVPLAIELAAARVTHLSLPTLRERLERRLPLLTGGGRDRPLRLQTMRDAIAWSHDLLSPAGASPLPAVGGVRRRLHLEAAEALGGHFARGSFAGRVGRTRLRGNEEDEGADESTSRWSGFSPSSSRERSDPPFPPASAAPPSVLDVIAALVEASLLRAETGPDGTVRYRMLETIREFAEERLVASGEAEAVRKQHAAYFMNFAERYELAELLPDGDRARILAGSGARQPPRRPGVARSGRRAWDVPPARGRPGSLLGRLRLLPGGPRLVGACPGARWRRGG